MIYVKIEHFVPRTPQNELQYSNLLAVCKGGEDGPVEKRSCDTRKGNRPIFVNPTDMSDMKRIFYSNSGEVHSSDVAVYTYSYKDSTGKIQSGPTTPDNDLDKVLNLNYVNGKHLLGRKTALRSFQSQLEKYKKDKHSKKVFLSKMLQKYMQKQTVMDPYVGILRWYIEKKLKQL